MFESIAGDPLHLLHLEDSPLDHDLVRRTLQRSGLSFSLDRVDTLDEFVTLSTSERFDAVLADYQLTGFTAIDAWRALPDAARRVPMILLSGAIGEAAAVAAIKLGYSDYLPKDDLGRLPHVLQRAIESNQTRLAKERSEAELAHSESRLAGFAAHLQTAIEQERASIAREIHDDIGGALAAAKLDLARIRRHLSAPASLSHLDAATEMLQHALGASQRIMMNLRPALLEEGLVPALEWLVNSFERRTGISALLRATLARQDLAPDIGLVAYRTAQEALTNVTKHAHCSRVRVELSDTGHALTLEVSDNGRGFSPGRRGKRHSFGLEGLHERARSIGGWLDVSSREGGGTSITLTVPLSDLAQDTA
ncbi:MAG: response regulator [Betaproteobacteria bacterium]|nr:response regulator [Betaproteobacteria bacterium]